MVEARLDAARVATLFRFARQMYAGGIAAAALVVIVLWRAFPSGLLLGWFAFVLAGMGARIAVHLAYRRDAVEARAKLWERRFALATLAMGAAWAYVPSFLFPHADQLLQATVVIIVGGVMMAGAGLCAASLATVYALVLPPLAATIVVLALLPDTRYRVLAVAVALFSYVVLRMAREIRRSLLEALRARLDTDALRERAESSEEQLRLAVEAAGLVYWEWDRDGGRLTWEQHVQPWTEYRDRVHPEDRERYLAAVEAAWKDDVPYSAEYRVLDREGRVRWISARGKALRDESGRVSRMIGVAQDVTERREQDDTVRFLAYHDALTGLPNRRLLDDRLKQALYRAERRESGVAVLLVDLDDFKQVNDSAGHEAGDAVLREVALRLYGCVRKADTLARHGGDEFVVVLADLAAESDCQAVAEKILRELATPFRVGDASFALGASIGIAVYPGDAPDGDGLLRNADAAMYRAKQLGRNHYRFFGKSPAV